MKPYSRTSIRHNKIHSADSCGVCANGLDSNKTARQKAKLKIAKELNGLVAQLDRASDYGSEGCTFESCQGY